MKMIAKPQPNEFPAYAAKYMDLIPENGQVLQYLQDSIQSTQNLILSFTAEELIQPCSEGEWSIKEILSHIMDSERAFSYRALRFARNDPMELSKLDQDLYVNHSGIIHREITGILEEYKSIRQSSLTLFSSLDEQALARSGLISGHRYTVRALIWMTAGHERHHINSILEHYR